MNNFPTSKGVPLPGSERTAIDSPQCGLVDPNEIIEVTVYIRRSRQLPQEILAGHRRLSHTELHRAYGSDPAEMRYVAKRLTEEGATVTYANSDKRRINLCGTVNALSSIFGTVLSLADEVPPGANEPRRFRAREGPLFVPGDLAEPVVAVLGLDDRVQGRPHVVQTDQGRRVSGYSILDLMTAYDYPSGLDGRGQSVSILELGGVLRRSDLSASNTALNKPVPDLTVATVDPPANLQNNNPLYDAEINMDAQIMAAVVPAAKQRIYIAANTSAGFVNAVGDAVHALPTTTILSISWGKAEAAWTVQAMCALNEYLADAAALGITVLASAGDRGSTDGYSDGRQHVNFPASSPYVLSCGGTRLEIHSDGRFVQETVWNDGDGAATGGGVSDVFDLPPWQGLCDVPRRSDGHAGRGVPDVSAHADPAMGYQYYLDGKLHQGGGTSAATPLWAGLIAMLAKSLGGPAGFLNSSLYQPTGAVQQKGFRPIVSGNNGFYRAHEGWNACAGLGTPRGSEILDLLQAVAQTTTQ